MDRRLGQTRGSAPTDERSNPNVGVDPRVHPGDGERNAAGERMAAGGQKAADEQITPGGQPVYDGEPGQTRGSAPTENAPTENTPTENAPTVVRPSLGRIVQWFKSFTTNRYIHGVREQGWAPFPGRLWHRNYYEHIIRNERALNAIRTYIENNPANWPADEYNPAGVNRKTPVK